MSFALTRDCVMAARLLEAQDYPKDGNISGSYFLTNQIYKFDKCKRQTSEFRRPRGGIPTRILSFKLRDALPRRVRCGHSCLLDTIALVRPPSRAQSE